MAERIPVAVLGATVSVFYISNVEDYLDGKWATYVANLKALPQDASRTSRTSTRSPTTARP